MTEQLTERYCVLVNGHAVEPGCWVDGHWGQYGPDHLADRASELGWEPENFDDDPRQLRRCADMIEGWGYSNSNGVGGVLGTLWEIHAESADAVEQWLNDHTTTEGYIWHWHDGEFYLSPICENGDCDDDTCAHWD